MTKINGTWQLKAGKSISESIAGTGSYESVLVFSCGDLNSIRIRCAVAGASLTGLKVTSALTPGGSHSDFLVDADLDSANDKLPWTSKTASGVSPYLTAAGSSFELEVDVTSLAEFGLSFKAGAAATLTIEVSAK